MFFNSFVEGDCGQAVERGQASSRLAPPAPFAAHLRPILAPILPITLPRPIDAGKQARKSPPRLKGGRCWWWCLRAAAAAGSVLAPAISVGVDLTALVKNGEGRLIAAGAGRRAGDRSSDRSSDEGARLLGDLRRHFPPFGDRIPPATHSAERLTVRIGAAGNERKRVHEATSASQLYQRLGVKPAFIAATKAALRVGCVVTPKGEGNSRTQFSPIL